MKNVFDELVKRIKQKRKKGFTLLESILSIAVFALCIVILTMFVVMITKNFNASYETDMIREGLNQTIQKGVSNGEYVSNQDGLETDYDGNGKGKPGILSEIYFNEAKIIGPSPIDPSQNISESVNINPVVQKELEADTAHYIEKIVDEDGNVTYIPRDTLIRGKVKQP